MFKKTKKIEDYIIEILSNGKIDTKVLIKKILEILSNSSKQAVYKSLKDLRENEIVIYKREEASLSSLWLKKINDFLEKAENEYKVDDGRLNILSLKEGEKVSYNFNSFNATDIFWAHAFNIFYNNIDKNTPTLIYNPHEWFLLAREESEVYLFNKYKKDNKILYSYISHEDFLDKYVKKYFDGIHTKYYCQSKKLFKNDNYYVNVFGDFIIEVWLDKKVSAEIDLFYENTKELNEGSKNELLNIINKKGKNKLVISKNKKKSEDVRKFFGKYFVFG